MANVGSSSKSATSSNKTPGVTAKGSLTSGAKGASVSKIQSQLKTAGYKVSVDGKYGAKTKAAVASFQKDKGLFSDGVTGAKTKAALSSARPVGSRPVATARRVSTLGNTKVNVQMPTVGPGFKGYYSASKRFGQASTVAALKAAAASYKAKTGKDMLVGDMSLKGGGKIKGHASHRAGKDVDLRPASKKNGPTNWKSPGYDRAATRDLLKSIRATGSVKTVYFNDPQMIREGLSKAWPRHDNHLHVRYN